MEISNIQWALARYAAGDSRSDAFEEVDNLELDNYSPRTLAELDLIDEEQQARREAWEDSAYL